MMEHWKEASDTKLVLAVARFEQDALAEIYRRHGGAMLALARRVSNSPGLAEEVVQEIFIKLWRDPTRYDPERGSLRSFLLAAAHSKSVDIVRSESARKAREEREARLAVISKDDVDREIVELSNSETVRAALNNLAETERRPIELAYFHGLTYKEVSVVLEQPEGTIKSRIRSGLKRLSVSLAEVEI